MIQLNQNILRSTFLFRGKNQDIIPILCITVWTFYFKKLICGLLVLNMTFYIFVHDLLSFDAETCL